MSWENVVNINNPSGNTQECAIVLAINQSGSRLIIGDPCFDSFGSGQGQIKIYDYNNGTTTQVGDSLTGNIYPDGFGSVACMSPDGATIFVGSPNSNYNITGGTFDILVPNSGHVKIYTYNPATEIWEEAQTIEPFDGVTPTPVFFGSALFGSAISLSGDGNTLAVSAPQFAYDFGNSTSNNKGRVITYRLVEGTWTVFGVIDGEIGESLGATLALNHTGTLLAIGSPEASGTGLVKIYELSNDSWTQSGPTIYGESNSLFGTSIAINNSDNGVFVGAPGVSRVTVHNLSSRYQLLFEGPANSQFGISLDLNSEGNRLVISGGSQNNVIIYELDENNQWVEQPNSISANFMILSVAINNTGNLIFIIIYDTATDSNLSIYAYIPPTIPVICFSGHSQLPVANGDSKLVTQLVKGDIIVDDHGLELVIDHVRQFNGTRQFFQVGDNVWVTGHHLVKHAGAKNSDYRQIFLASRANLESVDLDSQNVVYQVVVVSKQDAHYVKVSDKWSVEVWGQGHALVN